MEIGGPLLGIGSIVFVLIAIFLNIPIAFAFVLVGFATMGSITGFSGAMSALATAIWSNLTQYNLLAIPLFIVMGQFISRSGVGDDLYRAVRAWVGKLPGGLAIATIWGCGALGACTGSTTTGIMTFGPVAYRPMMELGYSRPLILGSICAGSTLGSIIPPSIPFVVLGLLTDQPVGTLFIAGILPGILEILLYTIVIILLIKTGIWKGPPGSPVGLKDKLILLPGLLPPLLIFAIVLGGIYTGFFTVTEAAAAGAITAFFILGFKKGFKLGNIMPGLYEAVRISCMMYMLIIGADYLSRAITVTGLSFWVLDYINKLALPPTTVMAMILAVFVIWGFVMPELPLILLFVPLLFPIVVKMGFSGIWFCVVTVVAGETAAITPPVGINLFLTQGLFNLKERSLRDLYLGAFVFAVADMVRLGLLLLFPQIALLLVRG